VRGTGGSGRYAQGICTELHFADATFFNAEVNDDDIYMILPGEGRKASTQLQIVVRLTIELSCLRQAARL
jgi:hypothetical protein